MGTLPSSIEAYLLESGFSSTELLVLKRLLEDDAMTLRQLAAKTGKSTGVLDQAMKKLLRRNIATKEWINDTYKYALVSLQAIVRWVEQDTQEKREMLQRRRQNFESFIHSLEVSQTRPDMQFYEGDEGIKQAYIKLLNFGKETLHYFPVVCAVEDDPLRDFRVEYFRERRRRGVFSRFIIHNTPLGRRFATRDPFEYRKTLLIPEDQYPISFEKVIVGDVVACINHIEKRACFIRYPEMADMERRLFERQWKQQENALGPTPVAPVTAEPVIPLSVRALSSLREFFLTRKSVALFVACAVLSGGITYGLYRQNIYLNTQRIRERAMAIASTAATKVDANDLDQIHTADDVKKPEFSKIVKDLQQIRSGNENVLYVYIYRPTGMPNASWEVIADADYGISSVIKDLNGNGVIEDSEIMTIPGQKYPHEDPNVEHELKTPSSTFITDEWGQYYDATAPIFDANGKGVAILGVDIGIQELYDLNNKSFAAVWYFLGIFVFFVSIRLFAFNKSLSHELVSVFCTKKNMMILLLCAVLSASITYIVYRQNVYLNTERIRERAMAIASTAAGEFDAKDFDELHTLEDMKKPVFEKVVKHLKLIRSQNEDIKYLYIDRFTGLENAPWEIIADTDYDSPQQDYNGDGIIEASEQLTMTGQRYPHADALAEERTKKPFSDLASDEWGEYFDSSAPILDSEGKTAAVLFVDVELKEVRNLTQQSFSGISYFLMFFLLSVVISIASLNRSLLRIKFQQMKSKHNS